MQYFYAKLKEKMNDSLPLPSTQNMHHKPKIDRTKLGAMISKNARIEE